MKKLTIYSIILFVIDLVTKILITNFMRVGDQIKIIPNFFSIMYVRNTGAAFSILENSRFFFIIAGILVLIFIYLFLVRNKTLNMYLIICYSMLIGGIIGNLYDRIVYGYVVDFLSFNIFGYYFPVFNIADSFIVISIILLIINELKVNTCKKL